MSRHVLLVLALIGALAMNPRVSSATFHLMNIVEVFPGTAERPDAQYVMLQAYSAFQNLVDQQSVQVFDASGAQVGSFTFMSNVSNSANQATLLIATPDAASLFGVASDLMMTPVIARTGGKVCYENIDCVSWGDFSGSSVQPSPSGAPFNADGGLTLGMAIRRNLGSNERLDAVDDSNDSAADFFFAPPVPRNNAGQTAPTPAASPTPSPTPTETPTLPRQCAGDCDSDLVITNVELLTLVDIALGDAAAAACPALATKPDGQPSVAEIVRAVNDATDTCAPVVVLPPGR